MSVNEGETISASLQLDAALTDGLILVNNAPFGGTATNGTDYTSSDTAAGGVYQTPSYTFSGTTVTRLSTGLLVITDDNAAEGPETVTWTWAIDPGSTTTDTVTLSPASFTVTILANDGYTPPMPTPSFSIAVDESTRAEGETAVFTVTLAGGAPSGGVTVDWAVSGAGITADDYTLSGADTDGTLSFTANGSQTLTFAITDDSAGEGDETLTVTLSNPSAGSITTASASTAITDDDTLLTVTGPARIAEGAAATYTITLTGVAFAAATTVTWAVTHGTTMDDDFSGGVVMGTVDFATSDTSGATRTFMLTAVEDDMSDAESFTLNITSAGLPAGTHVGPDLTVMITEAAGGDSTHDLLLPEVTRAVLGQQMQAIAGRVGTINGGGVGDSASFRERGFPGFAGAAAAHLQSLAGDGDVGGTGDLDAKELLRGLEFVMPLSASHGGYGAGVGDIAFWGGSDYRDFNGEDGEDDWDGSVLGLHFGVDGRVRNNLHAGLMVSYNDAKSKYTRISDGTTDKGDYELDMTSVSPFLSWRLNGGNAWASLSYGTGEVEVKPDGDEASRNDVNMTGVAAGGSRRLLEQNGRELSLRADAFIAESEVEGDGDNATAGIDDDLDVDANRLRVALAWNYPQRFSDGRLTPAFDLGLRHDGGDGRTGTGMELGGALKFYAPAVGLTLEGNARALLGHTGDHRAWGIGGLMRVESGADGQGLAVTVAPSYGGDFGGGYGGDDSQALWNGLRHGRTPADLHARLDAEVGYGMPAMGFGDAGFSGGMLTPYSALRVGDASRDYRLGVKWSTGPHIDLDLSARHINAATTDNAVTLEGRLRF